MSDQFAPSPSHWMLAQLGKKVLRPGGRALTKKLLKAATLSTTDRIVEFGPGVGTTAQLLLAVNPATYTGIDPFSEGSKAVHTIISQHPHARLTQADAQATGLPNSSATLVIGEAMLTMQSETVKRAIMEEAFRILKPGGRYLIHELGLRPDNISAETQKTVCDTLSRTVHVNANPLTRSQWIKELQDVGFDISHTETTTMALLESRRVIADEGLVNAIRFAWNALRNPEARTRIRRMRRVFRENRQHVCAYGFIAVKPHNA